MTAKRKSHHRISPWLRPFEPLPFTLETSLPLDEVSERLYLEFEGDEPDIRWRQKYRKIQREWINRDEIEVTLTIHGVATQPKLILKAKGNLRSTKTGTRYKGVIFVDPALRLRSAIHSFGLYAFIAVTASYLMILNQASFLLPMTVVYLLLWLAVTGPSREYQLERTKFLKLLKSITTDKRKGKAAP